MPCPLAQYLVTTVSREIGRDKDGPVAGFLACLTERLRRVASQSQEKPLHLVLIVDQFEDLDSLLRHG
jgi:hypothetical protein